MATTAPLMNPTRCLWSPVTRQNAPFNPPTGRDHDVLIVLMDRRVRFADAPIGAPPSLVALDARPHDVIVRRERRFGRRVRATGDHERVVDDGREVFYPSCAATNLAIAACAALSDGTDDALSLE
jgi:hypothetical protein